MSYMHSSVLQEVPNTAAVSVIISDALLTNNLQFSHQK